MAIAEEKRPIIDHPQPGQAKNCVVIANPGSGKTFTLEHKIRQILDTADDFRGVIAISYTNKASRELRDRTLRNGFDPKGSFFGTIDKFLGSEIIRSFGKHVFGMPISPQQITVKLNQLTERFPTENYDKILTPLKEAKNYKNASNEAKQAVKNLYTCGYLVLELYGYMALYILEQSSSCIRYMRTKYTHILIDEYQDCDEWQHKIFLFLADLGLLAVAVGDTNQSIFGFSGKDSRYLSGLASREDFHTYTLEKNHRSHASIVNYSLQLLSSEATLLETTDTHVHHKHLIGSEIDIGHWLNSAIPTYEEAYSVERRNQIAILVKDKDRTQYLLHQHLKLPAKLIGTHCLDESRSWGLIFSQILSWVYSPSETKYELVEQYLSPIFEHKRDVAQVMSTLREVEKCSGKPEEMYTPMVKIAATLRPELGDEKDKQDLVKVLRNADMLRSFYPAAESEVQVMTLHSVKGLEFDIVFHLNLYNWIMPGFQAMRGNEKEYYQDLNLHYVGITRAKKCCVLCTSENRHKSDGELTRAEISSFLSRNGIQSLRKVALI